MANIGSLGVEITANDAELRAAMKRAADATVGAFGQMQAAASGFGGVLARFAVAGAAIGIVTNSLEKLKGAIDNLDSLNDLSKRTAISVEALGGFKILADQSGTSLEELANGVKRLTKAQISAADGDEKMQGLLKVLGVTAREPQQALVQLAKAFESLDDQSKLEVATRIGKGFDKLIPLLSEGSDKLAKMAETAARLNPVTEESAEQADKFNDSLVELKAISSATWTKLASDALPALNNIIKAMISAREEGGLLMAALVGFGGGLTAIFTDDNLTPLQKAQKEIAAVNAQIALQKQRLEDAAGIAGKYGENLRAAITAGLQAANAKKNLLEAGLNKPVNPEDSGSNGDASVSQRICESGGGRWDAKTKTCTPRNEVDALRKKVLENSFKSLDRDIGAEKDLLSDRNHILDLYNKMGLLSFQDYYDARKVAADEALKNTIADYDREIEAAKKFIAESTKETDKAEGQGRLDKARDDREKAIREGRRQALDDTFAQGQAYHELAKQVEQVEASVIEFTGKLREAALVRFDAANLTLKNSLTNNNDVGGLEALALQRKQIEAQASLNELGIDASIITDRRANAESTLNILQARGSIGELTSLAARSEARRAEIEQLEVVYQARLKIAQESGNPRLLQDADNLRAKIEELRASSNLLEQAFDRIFVGSAADAFASFISGAKSAKDAFKDFVNSVVQQISKLAAQDLANSLFKGGDSGGAFGFFSRLFGGGLGGGSTGNAGGGFDPGLLGSANGNIFEPAGLKRFAKGGAFTNQIVSSPTMFKFANGTGLMGEAGPEAIMPLARDSSGRLGVRGGGSGEVNHFSIVIQTPDANSFRQSEGQIAAQMSAMVARGRRNR